MAKQKQGAWTPERTARFNATMAAKRAAKQQPKEPKAAAAQFVPKHTGFITLDGVSLSFDHAIAVLAFIERLKRGTD